MTYEQYRLTDSELLIEDPDMRISFRLPWNFPQVNDTPLLEKEGLVVERDEAGQIIAAYELSAGKKHGACRLFYPDGQIKAKMFYEQGALHGPSIFFSTEQKKLAETWYIQGKKVGQAKYFYSSGMLSSRQRFREGIPDGMQEYWYTDGKIKSLIPYAHGALHGEVRLFWESGQLKRSCCYAAGCREGWDRLWSEKGILIEEGQFRQGQPTGAHRQFFAHGSLKQELYYYTPLRFDRKEWNQEGKLLREGLYSDDLNYTERTFLDFSRTEVKRGYWDGQRLCWK